jgi:hypothetical protein
LSTQPLTITRYNEDNIAAAEIARMWFEWNNFRVNARNLWGEIDSYIHATDTSSVSYNETDHKTMIPVISEIHEDLNAIMYGTVLPHEDWLGWRGYDMEAVTVSKRKKVLSYIKHLHTVNGFRQAVRSFLDDYSRYGNCFCQVQYQDNTVVDEQGNVVSGFSGAVPVRISPYDIVFNPTAKTFDAAPKIIRTMMSVGEFVQWAKLQQSLGIEIKDEVIDQVVAHRGQGTNNTDTSNVQKNNQYVPDGFGTIEQYYISGFVEVLWFYGDIFDLETQEIHKNRCITVVDRSTELFNIEEKNSRIYKGSWKPRPDNLWAQGALDNIVGINYMVNHRENSKNDAIDRFIHPDRAFVGDVDEIYDENTGQTKYIMPEGGSVTDIRPDATVLTFNNEIDMHLDFARRAARLPQQLSGFRTAGEKTAFEVQALNDGAFRGFINKAEQFEQEFLEKIITAEIEVAKEHFSSVIKVLEEDSEGIFRMLEVTQDDLSANGKLVPYGARRFARSLQQQAGLNQLANSNLNQMIAPHVNTWNMAQAVNEVYGFGDYNMFGKFASIEEQTEAQRMQALAAEQQVNELSEPTMSEMVMDAEEEIPDDV